MIRFTVDLDMMENFKYILPDDEEMKEILLQVAKEFVEKFNDNVDNYQQTWDEKRLDRNSVGWSNYKSRMSYDMRTLVMKDRDFITPNMWNITVNKSTHMLTISMKSRLKKKFEELKDNIPLKNYSEVMPDPEIEKEMDWFVYRIGELVEEKMNIIMGV